MARPLVILGTHVFAEEVADIVALGSDHELVAFAENWDRTRCERPLLGRPVLWIDDLAELAETHEAVCALGTTRRREFIEPVIAMGMRFAVIRHPGAWVAPSAEVGRGSILGAGAVVAARARIGRHAILNRGVLVGHHTVIGDYVTISPGANVAGRVTIGEGAYVAMGATILDDLVVGQHSLVGAGALVTRDVPEHVQVQGLPARVVREGVEGR
jgi:acetyltransferase EpsM